MADTINPPFETRDRVCRSIVCVTSERTVRSDAFSGSRCSVVVKKELEIQSAKLIRAQLWANEVEKDANAAKMDASAVKIEQISVKIMLDHRFSQVTHNQHLQQHVHC